MGDTFESMGISDVEAMTIAAAAVATHVTARPGAVFTLLTGARVQLLTGGVTVPHNTSQPERHFLAPAFVAAWSQEMPTDPFFGPIFNALYHCSRSTLPFFKVKMFFIILRFLFRR